MLQIYGPLIKLYLPHTDGFNFLHLLILITIGTVSQLQSEWLLHLRVCLKVAYSGTSILPAAGAMSFNSQTCK